MCIENYIINNEIDYNNGKIAIYINITIKIYYYY